MSSGQRLGGGARVLRRVVLTALLVGGVLAPAPGVPPASAASPGWHAGVVARPTYLHAGTASSAVEEVDVTATGGSLFFETEEGGEFRFASVPFNASAKLVEEELQKQMYPERAVTVTGGPTEGGSHYTITFPGQTVGPMEVLATEGEAFVTPVSQGGSDGQIVVSAANLGDAGANGEAEAVKVGASLPSGLQVVKVEAIAGGKGSGVKAGPVQCTARPIQCTLKEGTLPEFTQIELRVDVVGEGTAATGEVVKAFAEGGGGPRAATDQPITIHEGATPFGVEEFQVRSEAEGGQSESQAGAHPFQLTTSFTVNQDRGLLSPVTGAVEAEPAALTKDLRVKLPPGLLGDVTAYPRCTLAQFAAHECQPESAIGVAISTINEPRADGLATFTSPVFNLETNAGEPARFGFLPTKETPVFIDTAVRTGGDYGVTASVSNIVQVAGFVNSDVTLWGVPGARQHGHVRGYGCLEKTDGLETTLPCEPGENPHPKPFLRLPTSCNHEALESSVEADSWTDPGSFVTASGDQLPMLDGCDRLTFGAQLAVNPEDERGDSPDGFDVHVHVPQESGETAAGLAPADVRTSTVTLPAGVALNAAAAGGLQACSLLQIGLQTAEDVACPPAAKIAAVEIKSPLLEDPLHGALYVAAQNANPFGSLIAVYLVASDPATGVLVKLAGKVALDPLTGQITSTFEDIPQLPFEDLKLSFFGGSRAALSTPAGCGTYTTDATFAPWSGTTAVSPRSAFAVTTGAGGGACSSPLGFTPAVSAGTTEVLAGGFTPFVTNISREDGQQAIASVSLTTPPGLSGVLKGLPRCHEADANAGTCPAASLIGETTVSAGVGSTPFTVTGGKVYLTDSYAGAPFGLSIATPAKAGPFDLGEGACDCIVVRARVDVDPHTAALTVRTDSTGHFKIPRILQGVPLGIKQINVTVNRAAFIFNPTNCDALNSVSALTGSEGATATQSIPFQITNCSALKFAPKLTASAAGKASKANGMTFAVKVTSAGLGQANIAKVNLQLPKALPSRLSTIQKACVEATFSANPAACPQGSLIGTASIHTPLLTSALSGPAYLVSHGGAAFPDVEFVLQGEGITLIVDGKTDIKKGITYSRFESVPDAPFTTFETVLPAGPHSALTANVPEKQHFSLCKTSLAMPTEITGQNGAVIKQTTKIAVTGCARVKPLSSAQKFAAALRACKKKKNRNQRAACERAARRKYAPVKAKKGSHAHNT